MRTKMSIVFLCAAALSLASCKKDSDALALPKASAAAVTPAAPAQPAAEHGSAATSAPAPVATTVGGGSFTGTTKAMRMSALTPQVSGKVLRVLVQEGDKVKKGAPLVQLDATDFKLHMRQAEAARNTARAQLAAVKIEWQRLQKLLRAKAIPSSQFDQVDSQFKVAQAGLAQAEVAVAMAKAALAKTTIRAPYSAVVTRKMLDEGAYATVMPPSPVVLVEELDRLEVLVQVPEGDMTRVRKGTPVTLFFRALNKTIPAKIARVVPSLSQQTRTFTAIAVLKNANHELRPGMFVEVALDSGAAR